MARYYSIIRPISVGTIPNDGKVMNIVNFDKRKYCPEIGREAWGYFEYDGVLRDYVNYDLIEQKPMFRRDLEPGDYISCHGTGSIIRSFYNQEVYNDSSNIERSYCHCEFLDTKGQYRSWKSNVDGGQLSYFDEGNLFDELLPEEKEAIMDMVKDCTRVMRTQGIDVYDRLIYFEIPKGDYTNCKLHEGYEDLGFVDLVNEKGSSDREFKDLLKAVKCGCGNPCFIAFPSNITGGRLIIQKKINKQLIAFSQCLDIERLIVSSSCLGASNKFDERDRVVKMWVRCHGNAEKVLERLNDGETGGKWRFHQMPGKGYSFMNGDVSITIKEP